MTSFTEETKRITPPAEGEKPASVSFNRFLHDTAKRSLDLVIALFGLILLSPFFYIISIVIKRDSPGPAFFWCPRMGKNEHPFRMLKFRTMYESSKSYEGLPVTCKEDDRITPVGHWLRDTKINELPQLWNVLIGEMSMVGPRPEDIGIAENWPADLRSEILSVKPGITSPASILYHDEENLLTQANVMNEYLKNILPDKMRLDRLYVRNQSLSSDLDLILWTLVIILPRMAKTKIPEVNLFAGPIFRLIHRYVSWFLVDLLITLFTVSLLGIIWRLQEPLNWGMAHLAVLALVIALLFSGFNSLAGLNRIFWNRATVADGLSLSLSSGIITLLLVILDSFQAIHHWLDIPSLPVVMIIAIGLLSQIGFLVARFRLRMVTSLASRWLNWRQDAQNAGEKVLIVGAGEGYQVANWLLRHGKLRYIFNIIGLVDDNIPTIQGMRLDGSIVLGSTADLPELVKKHDVGIILLTTLQLADKLKAYVFELCQTSNVRVAYIDNLIESVHQQLTLPVTSLEHSLWTDDHLSFLALHDYVTGLPNRYLFQDQLIRSLAYANRYQTHPVVLFISIDRIFSLNEIANGKTRDAILKEFTKHLLKFKRESDTLARLDEMVFGIILENVTDKKAVLTVAKRISRIISKPILLADQEYRLHANITFRTDMQSDPIREMGDIRKFYEQGKDVLLLEDIHN